MKPEVSYLNRFMCSCTGLYGTTSELIKTRTEALLPPIYCSRKLTIACHIAFGACIQASNSILCEIRTIGYYKRGSFGLRDCFLTL